VEAPKSNYDWPGWPLESNPFGEEFDLEARKRMVNGSQLLKPFIKKYESRLGKVVLEVGPFFNPLIIARELKNKTVFYWENDRHVLKWLGNNFNGHNSFPIYCDLNKIEGNSILKLKMETEKYFKKQKLNKVEFDSIISSHVFNYIDYKLFLMIIKDFLKKQGLLFINNVVDYGLSMFFSDKRPVSISATLKTLEETGYKILEKKIFESPDKKHQKNKRLIVVAQNC